MTQTKAFTDGDVVTPIVDIKVSRECNNGLKRMPVITLKAGTKCVVVGRQSGPAVMIRAAGENWTVLASSLKHAGT